MAKAGERTHGGHQHVAGVHQRPYGVRIRDVRSLERQAMRVGQGLQGGVAAARKQGALAFCQQRLDDESAGIPGSTKHYDSGRHRCLLFCGHPGWRAKPLPRSLVRRLKPGAGTALLPGGCEWIWHGRGRED